LGRAGKLGGPDKNEGHKANEEMAGFQMSGSVKRFSIRVKFWRRINLK
jgi:hypothetical protein